jgi:hypothetical protein
MWMGKKMKKLYIDGGILKLEGEFYEAMYLLTIEIAKEFFKEAEHYYILEGINIIINFMLRN